MSGSRSFEQVKGNYVRNEKQGKELIYVCTICNHEKLSINRLTGLWQCWRCGISGRRAPESVPGRSYIDETLHDDRHGLSMQVISRKLVPSRSNYWIARTDILELENYPFATVSLSEPITTRRRRTRRKYGVLLTDANNVATGILTYNPNASVRYCIYGRKSLIMPVRKAQTPEILAITEGFFDAVAINSYLQTRDSYAVCICGSNPSDYQLDLIRLLTTKDTTVLIAFDSDAVLKASKLWNRIRWLYRRAYIFLPDSVKDWDELRTSMKQRNFVTLIRSKVDALHKM